MEDVLKMQDSQQPNKDGSKPAEAPKLMRLITYKEWQAKSGHGQSMFVSQTPNRPSKDSEKEPKDDMETKEE